MKTEVDFNRTLCLCNDYHKTEATELRVHLTHKLNYKGQETELQNNKLKNMQTRVSPK